jgi:2-amino-4-hydroxy-6-hydroxymethyldihydropteridine diphosphokinase
MALAGPGRTLAFVGVGSNLDDPVRQVREAMRRLGEVPGCELFLVSSLYRSAPFGPVDQPDFVNAVVTLSTELGPRRLLDSFKSIERDMGREPGVRWGPRVIDLDLLVYGDAVVAEDDLVVPHPGIAERNFVLLPLVEIAPDLSIPGHGRVADLPVPETDPRIERLQHRTEDFEH